MKERDLTGCNEVLDDNPERWLITVSKVPMESNVGLLTETVIIETEPSLWFRSEKWQEFENDQPLYKMAVILMVHYIGK